MRQEVFARRQPAWRDRASKRGTRYVSPNTARDQLASITPVRPPVVA